MYILERLLGVLVYSIGLFLSYYAIAKKVPLKKVLFVYLLFLVGLAFLYVPGDNADLIRLRIWINEITRMPETQFVSTLGKTSAPLFYLFARSFGSMNMEGLIPAITALVSYSCAFYMLYKTSQLFKIDSKDIAISLLLFMSCGQFLQLISDVRSQMVFFVIAAITYREIILKKSILAHIPLYIACALFHSSAIALIGIRLFLGLFSMKGKKIVYKVMYCVITVLATIIVIRNGGNIINSFYEKTTHYLTEENYSYIWTYITTWLSLIISIIMNIKLGGLKSKNTKISNLARYCLCFNMITLVFSFEFNIFIRFQAYTDILNLTLYPLLLSATTERKRIAMRKVLKFASFILLTISCTRGDLSGYKFMKLE